MAAILNFRGACTDYLKIIKTMGDKLKLIIDIKMLIVLYALYLFT